jgi:hypothetical protein
MPTTIPTITSSDRASLTPSAGDAYFETDTKNYIIYDGANWRGYVSDGVSAWSGSNTYSLNFDGTDDYLSASSIVTPTAQQGTISAWIKTNTNAFMPIFSVSNNSSGVTNEWIVLQVDSGGKFEIISNRLNTVEVYESSSTVTDNAWHHVMITSSGSAYKLFLDGSEQTSASGNNTGTWIGDIGTKTVCSIGAMRRSADASNSYFNGNIDEVAVWDSDQSSNISTIYNSGTPGNLLSLNPKAWWRMGDGLEANSGTTIYDMSTFSNNMTIVNATSGSNTAGAVYQSDTP